MDFSEFSLHEDLLKGIASAGYVTCTPVQKQVLKTSLSGDDLYVQSLYPNSVNAFFASETSSYGITKSL